MIHHRPSISIFKMYDPRLLRVATAFVLWLQACAGTRQPTRVTPAGGMDPAVREAESNQSLVTWSRKLDGSEPVPSTGLTAGPPCRSPDDCRAYISECTPEPICNAGYCWMKRGFGNACGEPNASHATPGICRRALCLPAGERPPTCGEVVLLSELGRRQRTFTLGAACSSDECLEDARTFVREYPRLIGRHFVECLANARGFISSGISTDWNPKAPYTEPFPGLPERGASSHDRPPTQAPTAAPSSAPESEPDTEPPLPPEPQP
jgi:hypothetical protein